MAAIDDAPEVHVDDRDSWRAWLEANHATVRGAWLVTWRSASGRPSLDYGAAVEEALCFGWIDSRGGAVDDERSKLYFAPRNRRSGWARSNKERVERLIAEGRMAPAGLAAIEAARANGSWTILDSVERLEVPDDLAVALAASPDAREHWDAYPPSVRRMALTALATARRPETRARRLEEIVARARRGERPPG